MTCKLFIYFVYTLSRARLPARIRLSADPRTGTDRPRKLFQNWLLGSSKRRDPSYSMYFGLKMISVYSVQRDHLFVALDDNLGEWETSRGIADVIERLRMTAYLGDYL
jgi:hypothetical protein